MSSEDLEAIAVHEAGHMVVAYFRGVPLWEISIVPTDKYAGRVYCGWSVPESRRRVALSGVSEGLRSFDQTDAYRIDDDILITYGGPEAETVRSSRPSEYGAFDYPRAQELANMVDPEYLGDVIDEVSDTPTIGYLRHQRVETLRDEARRLVTDRWDLVGRLAHELSNRGPRGMSGDDVLRTIEMIRGTIE